MENNSKKDVEISNNKSTLNADANNISSRNINLNYFKMNFFERSFFNAKNKLKTIPSKLKNFFTKTIALFFVNIFKTIVNEFKDVYSTFKKGDFKTRLSFIIMGFGQFARGQILRGFLFIGFEIIFILYMIGFGWKYLSRLNTLGDVAKIEIEIDEPPFFKYVYVDNSIHILLYSIITIFIIFAFIYVWRLNIKQNKITQELCEIVIKPKRMKDDLKSIGDSQYHKTLLALPTVGLIAFTVLPIIFMVFIAFTNFDKLNLPPEKVFDWVGFDNFIDLLGGGLSTDSKLFVNTFKQLLLWTFIWSLFATFTNYFLGMIVAMMINKKGIKFKKLWRSLLILTIAVPQFVSLMIISQMLSDNGIVNLLLQKYGIIDNYIGFLSDRSIVKIVVILVNIWIGIPYTMLICTGILMNIPDDLYESAKIDGASPTRMFVKITLPYMLFVTGPYLLNQFIGNLNNFNVIFLLTGGGPSNMDYLYAGDTDLLITAANL